MTHKDFKILTSLIILVLMTVAISTIYILICFNPFPYSMPIYCGIIIIMLLIYILYGNKHFK